MAEKETRGRGRPGTREAPGRFRWSYRVNVVDDDEGLARVRAATSSAELQRLLITGHLSSRSSDYREAAGLLQQFHAEDVRGASDTAVLLMLSERWHPHTMKVTADLVASGILTDEALDEVAQRLLWPDRPTWTHPSSWFGIEFAVAPGPSRSPRHDTSPDRLVRTTLPAPRGVVRRWAATHLLRRGLTDVDSVVARCEGLSAYDADAVVAGIVEAIDALPELESERAVALGLAAGNSNTRLLALQALLVQRGLDAAVGRAEQDPSARVRAWAAGLMQGPTTPHDFVRLAVRNVKRASVALIAFDR